ncbi:MAG: HlyD family type I secretion periplasmic adaptor subunit [Steroidobacteraceae bacterium]
MSVRLRALALWDVGVRYRNTIAYHWRHRHVESDKSYTAGEAEFLPASLALIERPISPTARVTGLVLVLLVFFAILWAVLAHVDIIVTATGKVIPSSRTKTIASVDVASVRTINVVEGQSVRSGDVLVELDAGTFEADERKAEADINAGRLEMARSKALIAAIDTHRPPVLAPISGVPREKYEEAKSHLTGQYLDFLAKLTQLEGEITRYSQALPLAQERERNYEELAKTHDVSANSWSEKRQAAIDLKGQLAQAQNARLSLIAETRRQALDSLTDADKVVTSATQDVARATSHARWLTLRSPVDGSVQQLTVHTIGGVVPAAQPLMLIVPKEDKVEVEGYVENKDIGFVREGQSAEVKIDAFDYTKHGMIHGQVDSVSKDAIDDEKRGPLYKANVSLDSPTIVVDGRAMALTPGMTVQVEIKTGARRVIQYILSPLLRHRHESLNER